PGVDTCADRCNRTGCLSAGNQRQLDRIRLPRAMLQIDVVNSDPPVAHHDLACRGYRIRALHRHELFGPAMARNLDCEHYWALPCGAATPGNAGIAYLDRFTEPVGSGRISRSCCAEPRWAPSGPQAWISSSIQPSAVAARVRACRSTQGDDALARF